MGNSGHTSRKQKLSGADALDMRDTIARLREEKADLLVINNQLLTVLERILYAHDNHGNGAAMGEAVLCEHYADMARSVISEAKSKRNTVASSEEN